MTIKLLAIDTSTDACSAALLVTDSLIKDSLNSLTFRYEVAPQQHTKLILPMVQSLLSEAELTLQDVDVFAFGRGPGSFTGLRIAASVIQGFAFGTGKPVVMVSTLRALAQKAYRLYHETSVCAAIDARMQEWYWGLFKLDEHGIMQSASEEKVEAMKEIPLSRDWYSMKELPEARDIAIIALADYQLGHFVEASEAIPVYIRDKVTR